MITACVGPHQPLDFTLKTNSDLGTSGDNIIVSVIYIVIVVITIIVIVLLGCIHFYFS